MSDFDGEAGQVEEMSYCMKKSFNARNVDSMSKDMGYNNLADMANCKKPPVQMTAAKSNPQVGPEAGKGSYNYNSDR